MIKLEKMCEICGSVSRTSVCKYGIKSLAGGDDGIIKCEEILCNDCAVNVWPSVTLCPTHAVKVMNVLYGEISKREVVYDGGRKPNIVI